MIYRAGRNTTKNFTQEVTDIKVYSDYVCPFCYLGKARMPFELSSLSIRAAGSRQRSCEKTTVGNDDHPVCHALGRRHEVA